MQLCNGAEGSTCKTNYENCLLYDGPAQDKAQTLCPCAKIYYGICLREAGMSKGLIPISPPCPQRGWTGP